MGDRAQIEQVGAAATQVYECWQRAGLADKMSVASATLLAAAILDNTLYFGASVTTSRDHQAYARLARHANLPADWPEQYFSECERMMLADVPSAVVNDKKIVTFDTFAERVAAGQLAIWDARLLLESKLAIVKESLESDQLAWFMNFISIHEGKSYFYTTAPALQRWLEDLLGVHFDGDVAVADRMWLRKEIRRQDLERAATLSRAE